MNAIFAILIALLLQLACGCSTPVKADYDRCAGQYKYCPYGTLRVCMCSGSYGQCQLVCVKP